MVMSDIIPSQGVQQWQDVSQPSSLKFGLYLKIREMTSFEASLRQAVLLPRQQRQKWLMEQEDFVNELLDSFIADSALALDGLHLDSEAMALSIEFVTKLRDVMNMLKSIIDSTKMVTS